MKLIKRPGGNDSSQPDPTETGTAITETGTTGTAITGTATTKPTKLTAATNTNLIEEGGTEPVYTPPKAVHPSRDGKWHSFMSTKFKRGLVRWLGGGILLFIPIQLVKCTFRSDPKISVTASNSQSTTNNSTSNSGCATDLVNRMKQANITSKQIDRLFTKKYPEQQSSKIGNSSQDAVLKLEWCKLAEQKISDKKR